MWFMARMVCPVISNSDHCYFKNFSKAAGSVPERYAMKYWRKTRLLFCVVILGASPLYTLMAISRPYIGQESPGLEARVFAPTIVSITGENERDATFSPDGNELCFL